MITESDANTARELFMEVLRDPLELHPKLILADFADEGRCPLDRTDTEALRQNRIPITFHFSRLINRLKSAHFEAEAWDRGLAHSLPLEGSLGPKQFMWFFILLVWHKRSTHPPGYVFSFYDHYRDLLGLKADPKMVGKFAYCSLKFPDLFEKMDG